MKTIDQAGKVAPDPKEVSLPEQIESQKDKWRASLPAHISVERFARVVITAVQTNPNLVYADRFSLWTACSRAATDGLLPDGREGALVVYKMKETVRNAAGKESEKWIEKVQWMPMLAGIRKKVRNSDEVAEWNTHVVYTKDKFSYREGDNPGIDHEPYLDGPRGEVRGAYSIAKLKNGYISREYMGRVDIDKVRGASKAPNSPAWTVWFDEMARKVVARRHSKVLPMNTDVDELLAREDANSAPNEPPPPRPALAQFIETLAPQPEPDPPKEDKPDEKPEESPPEEKKSQEQSPQEIDPKHIEAYELGIAHRQNGKPNVPPSKLDERYHKSFDAGWRDENGEDTGPQAKLV